MRLIGALYDWLLFVHIVAAMIWVGAVAVLNVQATLLLRDHDTAIAQLRWWTWGMRLIAVLLVIAARDMVLKPGM
jgi:hypothetical protein